MTFALDASALIAFFMNEEGSDVVSDLILRHRVDCSITALNACEVLYDMERRSDRTSANEALSIILSLGVEIADELPPKIWKEAAHLKAYYHRLSLADAIGVAYAKSTRAVFVTSDHKELDPLAKDNVCRFLFFR